MLYDRSTPMRATTHTYSVSDSRFEVVDGQLKLTAGTSLNYETRQQRPGDGHRKDQGGLQLLGKLHHRSQRRQRSVQQAPTDISISNLSVNENATRRQSSARCRRSIADAGDKHSYTVSDNRFEVVNGAAEADAQARAWTTRRRAASS